MLATREGLQPVPPMDQQLEDLTIGPSPEHIHLRLRRPRLHRRDAKKRTLAAPKGAIASPDGDIYIVFSLSVDNLYVTVN